ncbi:hypothetical protein L7F22_064603 [Adiantum nelumboides]|nr:hypothetical protein [Adiantum nelumboides]
MERKELHAVMVPMPMLGHIYPLLRFAKYLVTRPNFTVTFVNNYFYHLHILAQESLSSSSSSSDGKFRFEWVEDGLPPDFNFNNMWQRLEEFREGCNNMQAPLKALMEELNQKHPPVSCVIFGSFFPWAHHAAMELGIQTVFFWSQSAAVFSIYRQMPLLDANGFFPFKEALPDGIFGSLSVIMKFQVNRGHLGASRNSGATWMLRRAYEQTMKDNGIQDREAVDGFHLIVVPELRARIAEIQAHQGVEWQDFKKALKEEYFLEDSQRVTKQSFMKWIKQRNKRLLLESCSENLKRESSDEEAKDKSATLKHKSEEPVLDDLAKEGATAQPIPILPPPSLPDPPASPVITPSTSHPVPPIQPPDVSPDHALSDSDSDLDVADATLEVDLAPPRREKRILGWLYSTVASSRVTELPVPPPAGLPRQCKEDGSRLVSYIPGVPPLYPEDFPKFLLVEDRNDLGLKGMESQFELLKDCKTVVINSFYELEKDAFEALQTESLSVFAVGPLLSSKQARGSSKHVTDFCSEAREGLKSVVRDECLTWLDKQSVHSVLYISFGTVLNPAPEKMKAIAMALRDSKQPFIWAFKLRPFHDDLSGGFTEVTSVADMFPERFLEDIADHGICVPWAPQQQVLAHPSVGAFLTHCGWNSTLESVSMGVPMIALPVASDQTTNSKYVVDMWKVGMRLKLDEKGNIDSADLMKVLLVVFHKEGQELRKRAGQLKEMARRAIEMGSENGIDQFLQALMDPIS